MKVTSAVSEFNSAIVAGLGALVVGVLMKIVSKLTDKRKDTLNEHLELRRELREELDAVKAEINTLQKELDEWREKYYHQVEVNTLLQAELASLRLELSEYTNSGEFNSYRDRHED
jgi:predicted nuclease with TOPRIM domain